MDPGQERSTVMKRILCVAFTTAAVLAVPATAHAETSRADRSGAVVHLNCHGDVAPAGESATTDTAPAQRKLL